MNVNVYLKAINFEIKLRKFLDNTNQGNQWLQKGPGE